MSEQISTIIIDNQTYDITMFSEKVQKLANIISIWEKELQGQQMEIAKTSAALREAQREILEYVNQELNPGSSSGTTTG
jgi:hypothetical protein